jgi:alkylated DNA repair protein alkB family protein 1
VNFYHMDSSIGGHTDHSEFDLSAPLLSFRCSYVLTKLSIVYFHGDVFCSFGQDAIFLLGKESRTIRPVAIRVGSGDVMIMAGPSRLSYHAVPRILRDSEFKCNIFVQDGQGLYFCEDNRICL